MTVLKCPDGKYRIGTGLCMYKTKMKAISAYAAYLAVSHAEALAIHVREIVERIRVKTDE